MPIQGASGVIDYEAELKSLKSNNTNKEKSLGKESEIAYKSDDLQEVDIQFGELVLDKNEFKTNRDIVDKIVDSSDDPTMQVWTVRSVVIGGGLAIFGGVLQCMFYFKPQTILVSGVFLMLIAHVLGELWYKFIPSKGWLRYINPGPWNKKELTFATIMAGSASSCALAIEVLAVQKLWYNSSINAGVGIFITFSSQLIGYSLVGLGLKKALLYPSEMFYPNSIPLVTTIHTLHNNKEKTKKQLKVFYWCFLAMFLYEIIPEWIFPWLIGVSIPCLAAPKSSVVSRIFGGTNGNEGLGLLSFCFDWNYIASTASPLTIPLTATVNNLIGYFLCIIVFCGVYYGNVWKSKNFPFLSQSLYYEDSEPGNYLVYNQTAILTNNILDKEKLAQEGVPYMTGTYVVYLIATNLSVGATVTHMLLFNRTELAPAFYWVTSLKNYLRNIKSVFTLETLKFWKNMDKDPRLNSDGVLPDVYNDAHMRAMLRYKEVPAWWYVVTFVLSFMVALVCLYKSDSGLPWYMLIFAMALSYPLTLFLGGLVAIFGFGGTQMQTVVQMIGGFSMPKPSPLANMYFTLFGYNSVGQAFALLNDLKLGYYVKLPPRDTFAAQMIGTVIGAIFNYIMMNSIVDSQFDLLKDIEATSVIWSGQNVQQYNTQGIAWGVLAKEMFTIGKTYYMVPLSLVIGLGLPLPFYFAHRLRPTWGFDNIKTPVLVWYIGWLCVGVNSSITTFFIAAFVSQFYLRKYKPLYFKKYNYIVAAALIGGCQVAIFILSFTIFGAGGPNTTHNFPRWWGNLNGATGKNENFDHCLFTNNG
ncbi:hypothetical protein KL930_004951 [Ogataea haglerorum]|uniref:uncharacterized protein n=1 Tax=Ogataea haglerorum TaxID=1937702 RepID=UPI001C8A8991|nr:uncharacterized protein KL911_004929 [Ogataea haglerorum]KAG7699842.1 hypothetical protein KL951_001559 [Ogataea haglerorum]KAG7714760.1 hypothetical protein KL949_004596 [Ogataea haglerorum]KAG7714962.1 hypothetical protein KL913_004283 [Ogataea haglerorum]KAG7736349.1 hypothetical protein KL923_004815 [Ogataea haglerorum]KAG7749936.1 hypothetical protein KL911_004929 [Ogataea haglerorum]